MPYSPASPVFDISYESVNSGKLTEYKQIQVASRLSAFTLAIIRKLGEDPSFQFRWPAVVDCRAVVDTVQLVDREVEARRYYCRSEAQPVAVYLPGAVEVSEVAGDNFSLFGIDSSSFNFSWGMLANPNNGARAILGGGDYKLLTSDIARTIIDNTVLCQPDDTIMHITEDFQGVLREQLEVIRDMGF